MVVRNSCGTSDVVQFGEAENNETLKLQFLVDEISSAMTSLDASDEFMTDHLAWLILTNAAS